MKLTVKGVNFAVTPSLRRYVDEKLVRSVEKFIGRSIAYEAAVLDIELILVTHHHKKGKVWEARANLQLPRRTIFERFTSDDMHAAVDGLENVLKHEIKKYKERSRSRELRGARKIKKDLHLSRSARFWRKGRIRQEST